MANRKQKEKEILYKKMDLSESERKETYEHYTKDSLELEETIEQ